MLAAKVSREGSLFLLRGVVHTMQRSVAADSFVAVQAGLKWLAKKWLGANKFALFCANASRAQSTGAYTCPK